MPALGYLDDVVIMPPGVLLALRLVPPALLEEHRARTAEMATRPLSPSGAAAIAAVWMGMAVLVAWWLWPETARGCPRRQEAAAATGGARDLST